MSVDKNNTALIRSQVVGNIFSFHGIIKHEGTLYKGLSSSHFQHQLIYILVLCEEVWTFILDFCGSSIFNWKEMNILNKLPSSKIFKY